jgi:cytochrome c-type biogenesis protein CcmH/NrfG
MSNKQHHLKQCIKELNREKSPERDLWQGIEIALVEHEKPSQREQKQAKNILWRNTLAIAASVCLVVLVSYSAFYGDQQSGAMQLVEQLSQQHEQQKARLLVSFQDMPTNTDNWQQQLNDLDEAEKAIKEALQDSPNNPALLGMLKHVYQQELAIIERVHAPKWQAI